MTRRKLPKLTVEIAEITPDMAKEWLEKNTFNRKKSDRLVDFYAESMLNDEWRLNGEPIIFDDKGKLQNGQHRLWACIEADVSFWSLVVYGADSDAVFTIDTGRKRSMVDALTLRGEKNVAILAATLVWIWRWEHQVMHLAGNARPTNVALLKMLDARPEIRDTVQVSYRFHNKVRAPQGLMCALWYQFSLINPGDAEYFLEQCVSGEALSSGDPAYAWRRWINARYLEASKPNLQTIAAITVKAWNAFRRHEQVKSLRWAGNEPFPEAV